jgi:electron transfer flavoprotein beta subunit
MGRDEAICREALAMGVDDAIQLYDDLFGPGADTFATAYVLSRAIKNIGNFDLILCGNETVDGSTAQVPPQIAVFLGIPHITRATKIEFREERKLRVRRSIEYGYMIVEASLPVVISVMKELNMPRIPAVQGILDSYQKEVKKWCAKDIEVEKEKLGLKGSPTRIIDFFSPEIKRRGEILKGPPEEAVKLLIQRLHELGVL